MADVVRASQSVRYASRIFAFIVGVKMRIEGILNDEERKYVKQFVKDLLKDKKIDDITSGYFGVKRADKFDNEVWFDVFRVIGIVRVKVEKEKHISKHNVGKERK